MTWFSQSKQDEWVASHIDRGFFVDLGAYDGINTSNTYALENSGWRGICVEANPDFFYALTDNRPQARNVHAFVSDTCGEVHIHDQHQTDDVSCPTVASKTLDEILDFCDAPRVVDYLSMDIEGMELPVLKAHSFRRRFNLITVEHNLYLDGPSNKDGIYQVLSDNGYVRVVDNALCLDQNPAHHLVPYEDWYAHLDFLKGQR
jgi:FkbM family methyltransferase